MHTFSHHVWVHLSAILLGCYEMFTMYLLSLKTENGTIFKIRNVQTFALSNNFRMFFAQQPANVGEEESAVTLRIKSVMMSSMQTVPNRVKLYVRLLTEWHCADLHRFPKIYGGHDDHEPNG